MNKTRKDIILKEIHYWKEHHLLPEHYCNFLITLYTEGSAEEQHAYNKSYKVKQIYYQIFISYIVFQLPTTIVIIYFTELNILLQTLIFTFFVLMCVCSAYYFYSKGGKYAHLSIVIGFLILFFVSNSLVKLYVNTEQALIINVLLNCLFWFVIGVYLRYKYLIVAGVISGLILLIYKLF
ncbi:hypothetical protein [Bacillus sp. Marseille-P3661]|uniref:hypothetical protein n=1 Tax=Bacillus sp. Marseille-P3661 TaxID=1936234 RepID=UPI000C82889B|nr:hypothetical protein [Bacillus sp. Marseille-P3661]